MTLIPTFQPGQRVLMTQKPNGELTCPNCGYVWGCEDDTPYEALIETTNPLVTCANCKQDIPTPEGVYGVGNGMYYQAVPYTWLTPLDEGATP